MTEQPFRVITDLRKAGKLDEAWEIGCPAVQENSNDKYLKGAFFWVCYAYLKEVQKPINERGKNNIGNFRPNAAEFERISFLLDWVVWLDVPPGGYEYKNLLILFQKNLDNFPQIVLLLLKHQDQLFGDEVTHVLQVAKAYDLSGKCFCRFTEKKPCVGTSNLVRFVSCPISGGNCVNLFTDNHKASKFFS